MNLDLFSEAGGAATESARGGLEKMLSDATSPVHYRLRLGGQEIDMNARIGGPIRLEYLGDIRCVYCDRVTNKSFGQGYCYEHFTTLAQCDSCMMSPEKCHFDQGTCREPEWGEATCMQSHYVYLANASGIKVGITRGGQVPTRWVDQGATQAMIIARVSSRKLAGLLEVVFKQHVADKTNWRTMLKGTSAALDLPALRDRLLAECRPELDALIADYGLQAIQLIHHAEVRSLEYPVNQYPEKVSSLTLDKQSVVEGTLLGIKGQYLILDTGVINIRRHTGYQVVLR